jgi:tRNA 2-selenouridine synthase
MGIEKITIQQFLESASRYPVLDVRSPAEFNHAHFPGAYQLPLFSDLERKVVGTAYKNEGKQQAIRIGLEYFGRKMLDILESAERFTEDFVKKNASETATRKSVIVHCWRGGMRSAGVAWLLDLYGFKVYTLTGGYKSFRRWCVDQFNKSYPFTLIGGYTGSGKTAILQVLKKKGSKIIDLEALANHKGSVFGHLGEAPQPSQEMFENRLALELASKSNGEVIFLEDESQRIGSVNIPIELFRHIQTRPLYFLEVPFENRLNYISEQYGKFDREKLASEIVRLRKRLGGLETINSLESLANGNIQDCFRILLKYYDKLYLRSLENKNQQLTFIKKMACHDTDPQSNAEAILQGQELETI